MVSSSRGGSTLFAEILRRCDDLLHVRAEVNPLFVVAGLSGGDTQVSAGAISGTTSFSVQRGGNARH